MMAISGSRWGKEANAAYHASNQQRSWNGVETLVSSQRAAACFQSLTNSTPKRAAPRKSSRAFRYPASVSKTAIVPCRIARCPDMRRWTGPYRLYGKMGAQAAVAAYGKLMSALYG